MQDIIMQQKGLVPPESFLGIFYLIKKKKFYCYEEAF